MRGLALILLTLGLGCDDKPQSVEAQASSNPWQEIDESQLRREIQAALRRARENDKRVLLEFVANWCSDCREVVRVSNLTPAADVIAEQYVKVFVNVGRFDKHRELISQYHIDRIATLVVLAGDGSRMAQTTLEPISENRTLSPERLAQWLREPTDRPVFPRRPTKATPQNSDHTPMKQRVFPPDLVR